MVEDVKECFKNPFFLAFLICSFFIYSGLINPSDRNGFVSLLKDFTCVSGVIKSNPVKNSYSGKYSFYLEAEECEGMQKGFYGVSQCKGKIKVYVPCEIVERLYPGRLYSAVKGDAVLFEQNEKIKLTGVLLKDGSFSANNVFLLQKEKSTGILNNLYEFRSFLRLQFKRLMYSWKNAGFLLLSLVSGSREYLDVSVSEGFRKAGLSHILALSGMHLSFFSGLSAVIAGKLFGKRSIFVLSLVSVCCFVFFVGLTPSLTRSFIFIVISLSLSKLDVKDVKLYFVLAFTFLVHCCIFPGDVMEVSFMLSYSALFGILLAGDFFYGMLIRVFPDKISSSAGSSVAAQLFTFPVSIKFFGEVMPAGILSTIFVSPLITVFMTIGFFAIIICLIMPFLSPLFCSILNGLYDFLMFFVNIFMKFPSVKFSI